MNAKELARQVAEAEALVKRLERGETATPKDSQSVTLRNSHGGYAGKSLIEKIRDDLRETIDEYEKYRDPKKPIDQEWDEVQENYLTGLIDGMCHALGILRGNDGETERNWAQAEYRETKRQERKVSV